MAIFVCAFSFFSFSLVLAHTKLKRNMQRKDIIYASSKDCPFITGDKIPEYVPEEIIGCDNSNGKKPILIGWFLNSRTKERVKMAIPMITYITSVGKLDTNIIPKEWATKVCAFYNLHGGKERFQQMLRQKAMESKVDKIYSDSQEDGKQETEEPPQEKPKEKPSLSVLQQKIDAAQKAGEKKQLQETPKPTESAVKVIEPAKVEPAKVVEVKQVEPVKPAESTTPTEVKKPLQVPVGSGCVLYKKLTPDQLKELGMSPFFRFALLSKYTIGEKEMDTDIERMNTIVDEIMRAKAGASKGVVKPADIEDNKNIKNRTDVTPTCSYAELEDKRQRYALISLLEAYRDGIITPSDAICFRGNPSAVFGLSLGHAKSQLKLKGSIWFVMLAPKEGIAMDEIPKCLLYGNDYLDMALSFLFYAQKKDVGSQTHEKKMDELKKTNYLRIKTKSGKNVVTLVNLWHLFIYQDKNAKPKIQEYINALRNDVPEATETKSMEIEPVKEPTKEPENIKEPEPVKEVAKRKPETEPEPVDSEPPSSPTKKQKSKPVTPPVPAVEPMNTEPTTAATTTTTEGNAQTPFSATTDYDTFVRRGIGADFYGSYLDGKGRLTPEITTELRGTVNESFGFEMVKNAFMENVFRKEEYKKEATKLETGDWRSLCSIVKRSIAQERDEDDAIITSATLEKEKLAKQVKQLQDDNKKHTETIEKMTLDASLEREKINKLESMTLENQATIDKIGQNLKYLESECNRLTNELNKETERYQQECSNTDSLRTEVMTLVSEKEQLEKLVYSMKEQMATMNKGPDYKRLMANAESLMGYMDALSDVHKGITAAYAIFNEELKPYVPSFHQAEQHQ